MMKPHQLLRASAVLATIGVMIVLLTPRVTKAQPVIFDVETPYGGDTIYLGNPTEIIFYVDAGPHELIIIEFALALTYPNVFGFDSLVIGDNLHFSPHAVASFSQRYVHEFHARVQMPDTMVFSGIAFGSGWLGADWFAKIDFEAHDTGSIILDTILVPLAIVTHALDRSGTDLPLDWRPGPIVVIECPWVVGDLNGDGVVTLGDIIMLINYVFKSGTPPQPHVGVGDGDCNGVINTADIFYLINYQGKGGPAPCGCSLPFWP